MFLEGSVGALEHTLGTVEYEGVSRHKVTDLVRQGKGLEALLRCIVFPSNLSGSSGLGLAGSGVATANAFRHPIQRSLARRRTFDRQTGCHRHARPLFQDLTSIKCTRLVSAS